MAIVTQALARVAGAVGVDGPGERPRRVWTSGEGRVHIELRGVGRPEAEGLAGAVESALERLGRVRWAEVDRAVGTVVVALAGAVDDEEGGEELDVSEGAGDLVDAVESAEAEHGLVGAPLSGRPEHPGDPGPARRQAVALGADLVGIGVAVASRAVRAPRLPRPVGVAVALVEGAPRLRAVVEGSLGVARAEVVLPVTNAATQALTGNVIGLAVDAALRLTLLTERLAHQRAWLAREPELFPAKTGVADLPVPDLPRPVPLPEGVAERWADRAGLVSLGAGVVALGVTRDVRVPAAMLAAGLPRASRLAAHGFTAQLGRDLAGRGVVVFDRGALLRLDRIDTLVLDARLLEGESLDPVVVAGRRAGLAVILAVEGPSLAPAGGVDRTVAGGADLVRSIHALQKEGAVVALLSARSNAGLRAADLGLGLLGRTPRPPLAADVLLGPGLDDTVLVLAAASAARRVARASTVLALGASLTGGGLAVLGPPAGAVARANLSVSGAGMVGLLAGTLEGVTLGRAHPRPAVREVPRTVSGNGQRAPAAGVSPDAR
ncbi:MAG: hypothetical protein IPM45_15285 [Acidimicrobiales bacterium]|nr:hypothetical protein [Acidimicrobiales bacterium]